MIIVLLDDDQHLLLNI